MLPEKLLLHIYSSHVNNELTLVTFFRKGAPIIELLIFLFSSALGTNTQSSSGKPVSSFLLHERPLVKSLLETEINKVVREINMNLTCGLLFCSAILSIEN